MKVPFAWCRGWPRAKLAKFVALLAAQLMFGVAIFELAASRANAQVDEEALALRSRALSSELPDNFVFGSSLTMFVVAGVLLALIAANVVGEARDDSFFGDIKRLGGNDHADRLYLPVTIQRRGSRTVEAGHLVTLGRRRSAIFTAKPFLVGTRVSVTPVTSRATKTDAPFHCVIMKCRKKGDAEEFTLESRMTPSDVAEQNALMHWISELKPLLLGE